jgi:hypothetical protein
VVMVTGVDEDELVVDAHAVELGWQYVQSQDEYSTAALEALAAAQPETMQEPTTEVRLALQREPSEVTLYCWKQLVWMG